MTHQKRFFVFFIFMCFLLAGCEESSPSSRTALFKRVDPAPLTVTKNPDQLEQILVRQVKDEASSVKSIYDVAVIKGQKEILVAYKVKHMSRFRMKGIESDLNKILSDKFPDHTFTVSSDYKIFLEAIRLGDKMKNADYSEKNADKRLKQIINLTNELT
ncbi:MULTISPECIES: sporulation protein [Bacillaceae]|uniref:sporulation protein n=1 Tax=Bacillaceae TaxID=186817 RepID=UPI001E64482B|nr:MULTISPECIES: sporulation protein [Bacillaceae]MCE4050499.1 sporulation protein [Bacillus sp. Au-Bac7]MCM3030520.1 sporulation protein [Niallia sp. MER 6]MDL0434556.1 sporulation protein [Niallia sp. SS-2023]UPO88476.1 sporulation protein [Niallia sp. Man26]